MNNASTLNIANNSAEDEADLRGAIQKMFAQMAEADVRIARDQADIDRLKAETRAILASLPSPHEQ